MTIKTQITLKDHRLFFFSAYYRSPRGILFVIVAFIMLAVLILSAFGEESADPTLNDNFIRIGLIAGILFWIPFSIYRNSGKSYATNPRIQECIEYTFTEEQLKINGTSFSSVLDWTKTYKIVETKWFFLIYQSKATANLIAKKDLTGSEITELRSFFRNLYAVKIKKLMPG